MTAAALVAAGNSIDLVMLALVIFGSLAMAVVLTVLSAYRKDEHTRAQGALRAAIVLLLVGIAVGAYGAAHGWPVALRVTPLAAAAYFGLGAAISDAADEVRKDPHWGPVWPLRLVWTRGPGRGGGVVGSEDENGPAGVTARRGRSVPAPSPGRGRAYCLRSRSGLSSA